MLVYRIYVNVQSIIYEKLPNVSSSLVPSFFSPFFFTRSSLVHAKTHTDNRSIQKNVATFNDSTMTVEAIGDDRFQFYDNIVKLLHCD